MEIRTNKDLSDTVSQIIKDSGIKKTWIAEQLGISRQAFYKMMNSKDSFSLDDANKILKIVGQHTETVIKKDYKKE